MLIANRQVLTVVVLMIWDSGSAFGQSFATVNESRGDTSAQKSSELPVRYFHEDPVYEKSAGLIRTAAGSGAKAVPGLSARWPGLSYRPFPDGTESDPQAGVGQQIRYRVPLNRSERPDELPPLREDHLHGRFPWEGQDLFAPAPIPASPRNSERSGGDKTITIRSQDPFIPVPLPKSQSGSERSVINEIITQRYQNPVTVRVIRAMTSSQAVSLFSEVSQKIDERSLELPSYDVRKRRALRNLMIALENESFVAALGLTVDSFQLDGFRNTLARLAGAGPVRNYQDARSVLTTVMRHAEAVQGLTPGVVGFEFTNASIDTLDKFSGLEPADPALRTGFGATGHDSDMLKEQIVGIGVEVREHSDGLLIIRSLRGGPAAEAGIASGDIIRSINGRSLRGMKMAGSVDLMTGPSGSQIRIRVDHEVRGARELVLTRRTVRVWTVNDAGILSGTRIGYFSLSRFSQGSTQEVDQVLESLHRSGMESLIIDLRGNPGGLLTTCVEITDRFVPCGTIVSTRGRLSSDNMTEEATYSNTWRVPVVVLVDGDSASASEIFAAAIQENRRGLVVGVRSYGKGSVQTHFPLTAIDGDLRLTTALFYSPRGRPMSGSGVLPDVPVEDPDGPLNGDSVLEEAERIAVSRTLKEMATIAGSCRTRTSPGVRSSSLDEIIDPIHPTTRIL